MRLLFGSQWDYMSRSCGMLRVGSGFMERSLVDFLLDTSILLVAKKVRAVVQWLSLTLCTLTTCFIFGLCRIFNLYGFCLCVILCFILILDNIFWLNNLSQSFFVQSTFLIFYIVILIPFLSFQLAVLADVLKSSYNPPHLVAWWV